MKKYIIGLGLLAGCAGPATNLDPMQRAAFLAVEEAWYEAGLPVPHEDCNLDAFVVVHATSKKYWELCGSDPQKSAGCSTSEHIRPLQPDTVPIVVVSPKHYIEPTIITHELSHAFQRCTTGRDYGHSDPKVWQAAGGDSSVQARANKILQEQGWL